MRKLIDDAHDEAWHALNDNRDVLDRLVLELLEKETLNAAELAEMFKRRSSSAPVRPTWLSSEHRAAVSDLPAGAHPGRAQAAMNGHSNGFGATVRLAR